MRALRRRTRHEALLIFVERELSARLRKQMDRGIPSTREAHEIACDRTRGTVRNIAGCIDDRD
jgi:hypothetical protein